MSVSAGRAARGGVCVLVCVAFLQAAASISFAQQPSLSIRQQLQETGDFDRIVVTASKPLRLADLVERADLIVEASTAGGQSYLNRSETDIYTDYMFNVHAVVKNRRFASALRVGDAVPVRRESGVVVLGGRAAAVYENGFPAFTPHEHYFLFLTQRSSDVVYSVVGGPQGAFSAGEEVRVVTVGENEAAHSPSLSRAAFLREVSALLGHPVTTTDVRGDETRSE